MKTVYKYRFETKINMPEGAKILSAQYQDGEKLYFWVEIETDNKEETRKFIVYGTGHPIRESNLSYIASVQNPPFVWHIYEIK